MLVREIEDMVYGYIDLMKRRPELFPADGSIVTDPKTMLEYATRNDCPVGLVYESPWHYLLVDVIKQPDGTPGHICERYIESSSVSGVMTASNLPDGQKQAE